LQRRDLARLGAELPLLGAERLLLVLEFVEEHRRQLVIFVSSWSMSLLG
jgi:hypothetical protein